MSDNLLDAIDRLEKAAKKFAEDWSAELEALTKTRRIFSSPYISRDEVDSVAFLSPVTRIWVGKRDWVDTPYYEGQLLIAHGERKGSWLSLTRKCHSLEQANRQLDEVLQSFR